MRPRWPKSQERTGVLKLTVTGLTLEIAMTSRVFSCQEARGRMEDGSKTLITRLPWEVDTFKIRVARSISETDSGKAKECESLGGHSRRRGAGSFSGSGKKERGTRQKSRNVLKANIGEPVVRDCKESH